MQAAPQQLSLDTLRSIVQDSLGKHLYENAIFFADKLVTLSRAAPDDVYRLLQVFVFTKQYRRALNLLRTTKLETSSARFRYITAKCLAECQEWEECLATLGEEESAMADEEGADALELPCGGRVAMAAAMQLLRGTVYESLENWPLAAKAYTSALRVDPLCYEALDRLVRNHMLSTDEQLQLLAELEPRLAELGAEWLQVYYRCKLDLKLGSTLAGMYAGDEPPSLELA
jgi:anaphase-promoting complex subunit 6